MMILEVLRLLIIKVNAPTDKERHALIQQSYRMLRFPLIFVMVMVTFAATLVRFSRSSDPDSSSDVEFRQKGNRQSSFLPRAISRFWRNSELQKQPDNDQQQITFEEAMEDAKKFLNKEERIVDTPRQRAVRQVVYDVVVKLNKEKMQGFKKQERRLEYLEKKIREHLKNHPTWPSEAK